MGENLHNDNLEDFFKKSFHENDQNPMSDDWDLPDDKVWKGISSVIQEEPTKLIPIKTFAWKKGLGVAASFLVLTLAFCVYQNQQKQLDALTAKVDNHKTTLEKLQEQTLPDSGEKVILPSRTSQPPKGVAASPKSLFPEKQNISNSITTEKEILPSYTSQSSKEIVSSPKSLFSDKQNTKNTVNSGNKIVSQKPTDESVRSFSSDSNNIATTITNSQTTSESKILEEKNNLKNLPVAQNKNTVPHIFNDKKTDNKNLANTNNFQDNISGKVQDKWEVTLPLNTSAIALLENNINFTEIKHSIKHSPAPIIKTRTPLDVKFSLGIVQGFHKMSHTLKGNRPQTVPTRNHRGQHYAYTTGIAAGIHFNKHFSIESGIAMGVQNSNLRIKGRRHLFPRPEIENPLPDNQGFESRTSIPYYSGTGVAETDIVITRPEDVQPDRFEAFNLNFHIKSQRRFLRIPLQLKYTSKSLGPVKFTASAGIVGNIGLKQTVAVKSQSSDQRELAIRLETAPPARTAKASYDFVVGAGLELPVASNWSISLEPSFSKGLTKVKPDVGSNVTTNMANVVLGARYRF